MQRKKQLRSILMYVALALVVAIVATAVFDHPVLAQVNLGLQQASQTGLSGADPRLIAARIIQAALGVLGIVALGLFVFAGYLWMTSAGNEEQVSRAKVLMRNAIIGIIIILSAFGIVTYVLSILAPGQVPTNLVSSPRGFGGVGGGGGFPIGVISSHYPDRGQTDVPRNTNIMVAFTEPILRESIIDDGGTPDDPSDDTINTKNIHIRKTSDDPNTGPFVQANAAVSDDLRTFVFDPVDLLGSSDQNTSYTVTLGEGIQTATGRSAFGNFGAYEWNFEVGTFIDLTPPQLESVVPEQDSTHARNVVVQMTFNEAVNPLTASGSVAKGFNNIVVAAGGKPVDGRFQISNQYKTVEFITNDLCGKNSCGEDVYCLPASAALSGLIKAATLSLSPPTAAFPYDGVTDAAGNSFDGNQDGTANGPDADNFQWSFNTTDQIDLTAPQIVAVSPDPAMTQVKLDSPLSATFSKPLQFSTITRQSVSVDNLQDYRINASTDGGQSTIQILHHGLDKETTYTPNITSDIRDLYQNCYRPCTGP